MADTKDLGQKDSESLKRELTSYEAALRIIGNRESLYSSSKAVPVQLKKDAELLRQRINIIRDQLSGS
jgi:hypothetical protein